MGPHSSILAWRIPWTEEPGGLQSMGSQRVRHSLATKPSPSVPSHLFLGRNSPTRLPSDARLEVRNAGPGLSSLRCCCVALPFFRS